MTEVDPTATDLSRRTLLTRTAAASAALTVSGVAVSGSAAGRQGGTGFVPEPEFQDDPFRIVEETPEMLMRSPSCDSDEPEEPFQGYEIVYEVEPPARGTLFVNPERNIDTGGARHEFVRDEPCGSERAVTFKPDTNRP